MRRKSPSNKGEKYEKTRRLFRLIATRRTYRIINQGNQGCKAAPARYAMLAMLCLPHAIYPQGGPRGAPWKTLKNHWENDEFQGGLYEEALAPLSGGGSTRRR